MQKSLCLSLCPNENFIYELAKLESIINLKKEEPGNEKPLFIGIAQYAFLYDLCCKLKQDNGQ